MFQQVLVDTQDFAISEHINIINLLDQKTISDCSAYLRVGTLSKSLFTIV